MPRITVLLPVHNAASFLKPCLESLSNQSFTDFRVLVLDDESQDETTRVVARHREMDRRFELISFPKSGLVKVLNAGLDITDGEFIARMDADDICSARRFESQLQYLEEFDLQVVGSDIVKFGCDQAEQRVQYPRRPAQSFAHALLEPPVAHSAVLAQSRQFQKYRYDDAFEHAQDYDLWQRMLSQGVRFGSVPQALVGYRIHTKQASSVHSGVQLEGAKRVRWRHLAPLKRAPESVLQAIERACLHAGFEVSDADRSYFVRVLRKLGLLSFRSTAGSLRSPGVLGNFLTQAADRKRLRRMVALA